MWQRAAGAALQRCFSTTKQDTLLLVKKLRAQTGAPLGDVKKALEASNNDLTAASEQLRRLGVAAAAKKASRSASQVLLRTFTAQLCLLLHQVEVGVERHPGLRELPQCCGTTQVIDVGRRGQRLLCLLCLLTSGGCPLAYSTACTTYPTKPLLPHGYQR